MSSSSMTSVPTLLPLYRPNHCPFIVVDLPALPNRQGMVIIRRLPGAASLRFVQGCGSSTDLPLNPPGSANFNDARLADGLQRPKFAQHFRRDFLVHVDNAHRFFRILHAAEGEIGDVDFVLAEQCADAADDAWDVL